MFMRGLVSMACALVFGVAVAMLTPNANATDFGFAQPAQCAVQAQAVQQVYAVPVQQQVYAVQQVQQVYAQPVIQQQVFKQRAVVQQVQHVQRIKVQQARPQRIIERSGPLGLFRSRTVIR